MPAFVSNSAENKKNGQCEDVGAILTGVLVRTSKFSGGSSKLGDTFKA